MNTEYSEILVFRRGVDWSGSGY